MNAELAAITYALHICNGQKLCPHKIYTDCPGVVQITIHQHPSISLIYNSEILELKQKLIVFPNYPIVLIPREDNFIADRLASHGGLNP